MKRISRLFALAGVAVLALLCGCVSGGALAPESVGENETVVAVPLVILDAQFTRTTGDFGYKINLENVRTGEMSSISVFIGRSDGISFVRGLPEGEYLIKEYMPLRLSNDRARPLSIRRYLKVKKGEISLFPAKLVMIVVDPDRSEFTSNVYFMVYELSDAQQRQILDFIMGKGPYFTRDNRIHFVGPSILDLDWNAIADWAAHCSATVKADGPRLGIIDDNTYSINVTDDYGFTYMFTREASADPVWPLSLSTSLMVPVFYNDAVSTGLEGSFTFLPARSFFFLGAGAYFEYKFKPFAFFADAQLVWCWFDQTIGVLPNDTIIGGVPYDTSNGVMHVIGSSACSFVFGLGVKWHFIDWLYLELKYNLALGWNLDDLQYTLGYNGTFVPAVSPSPVSIPPQNIISFGIGIGLD